MRQRLGKQRPRSDAGQALIVLVLALPMFFGMAAVVVDATVAWVGKRSSQNAADAASVAAVQELNDVLQPPAICDAACHANAGARAKDVAADYVAKNGGPTRDCDPGDPNDSNCYVITWPYNGSEAKIEVVVKETTNTFFGKLLGLGDGFFKPKARAVASAAPVTTQHCYIGETIRDDLLPTCELPGTAPESGTIVPTGGPDDWYCEIDGVNHGHLDPCELPGDVTGGSPALMFAHCGFPGDPCTGTSNVCDAMHFSGSNNILYGAVVSNGGVNESGSNFGAPPKGNAGLYYGTTDVPKCLTYKPTWVEVKQQAPIDWPVPIPVLTCSNGSTGLQCPGGTWATKVNGVNCTKLPSDKYTVNAATDPSGQPWNGLYCATVKITINQSGLQIANAGFIAPDLQWSSGSGRITGYTGLYAQYGGLLFDAYAGDLNWSGSNNSWTGAIFTPFGVAHVSGGGLNGQCGGVTASACGFIEGQTVQVSGSDGSWAGLGPSLGGTQQPPKIGTKKIIPGTTDWYCEINGVNYGHLDPCELPGSDPQPGEIRDEVTGADWGLDE